MSFLSTDYKQQLDDHLVFSSLKNLNQLRAFMELHVYAVWDFMSLLKSLQAIIAPHGSPWLPNRNTQVVRLINEIVLEEESDLARPNVENEYASHFDMYLSAMDEIGASTEEITHFISEVEARGIEDDDDVTISSPVGEIQMKAWVTDIVLPGVVHAPHGWEVANINSLFPDDNLDPISGYPTFKSSLCQVAKH